MSQGMVYTCMVSDRIMCCGIWNKLKSGLINLIPHVFGYQSASITFNIARNQEMMLTVCDFDEK